MSRNQRIMLVVAALAVAVIAFVIASPGSGDEDGEQAAQTTTTQTETQDRTETGAETETQTETEPAPPPEVSATRIRIQGGQVVGGAKTIEVTKGEPVRLEVVADAPDDIHVHGYDLEKSVEPGAPARFNFKANLEGVFEVESHVAEDAGRDPLVARLVVNPS
jgi:FtsP/CotA-like multicopper oxidase with cupredoxin domain